MICEQAQAPVLCAVKATHTVTVPCRWLRLEKMGAPVFRGSNHSEGAELREAGIETPILILYM